MLEIAKDLGTQAPGAWFDTRAHTTQAPRPTPAGPLWGPGGSVGRSGRSGVGLTGSRRTVVIARMAGEEGFEPSVS